MQYISSRGIFHIYHPDIETRNILIDGSERQRLRSEAAKRGPSIRPPSHAPNFRVVATARSPNPHRAANMAAPRSPEVIDLCDDDDNDEPKAKLPHSRRKLNEFIDQATRTRASSVLPSGRETRDSGGRAGDAERADFPKRRLKFEKFATPNVTLSKVINASFKERSCSVLELSRQSGVGSETSDATKDSTSKAAPSKFGVVCEPPSKEDPSTFSKKRGLERDPRPNFELPSAYPMSPSSTLLQSDGDDPAARPDVSKLSQTKRARDNESDIRMDAAKKRKVDLRNGMSRSSANPSACPSRSGQLCNKSSSIQAACTTQKPTIGRPGDLNIVQKKYKEVIELSDGDDRSNGIVQAEKKGQPPFSRKFSEQRDSSLLGRAGASTGSMLYRYGGAEKPPTQNAQANSELRGSEIGSPCSNKARIFNQRGADQTSKQKIDPRNLPENEVSNDDSTDVNSAAATFALINNNGNSSPQPKDKAMPSNSPRQRSHQDFTDSDSIDALHLTQNGIEVAKNWRVGKRNSRGNAGNETAYITQWQTYGMPIGGEEIAAADEASGGDEMLSTSKTSFLDNQFINEKRHFSSSPFKKLCKSVQHGLNDDMARNDAGLKLPLLESLDSDTPGTTHLSSEAPAATAQPPNGSSGLTLGIATGETYTKRSKRGSEALQPSNKRAHPVLGADTAEFVSLDLPSFASNPRVTALEESPEQLKVDKNATSSGTEAQNKRRSDPRASQRISDADVTLNDHSTVKCGADDATVDVESVAPPFASLTLSQQVDRVLGESSDEYRDDKTYWTRHWLKKARFLAARSTESFISQPNYSDDRDLKQKPYSFKGWKPVSLHPRDSKDKREPAGSQAVITLEKKIAPRQSTKATFTVPVTWFERHDGMPTYSHYVSIGTNFLAPNNRSMQHWPYFEDDFNYDEAESLLDQYNLDIKGRKEKLDRLQKAQSLSEYIGAALQELQVSWHDVLRYLLEQHPDVGDNVEAQQAYANREDSCSEEFTRKHHRSVTVLSSLPPSTSEALGKAAVLCQRFQERTDLKLWHIARRYQFDWLPSTTNENSGQLCEFLTCRICLRFNCPYHGEIEESDDEDYASTGSASDNAVASDIVHPPKFNQRIRISFPSTSQETQVRPEQVAPHNRRTLHHWQGYKWKNDDRGPFYPCHHAGTTCEEEGCSCFENNLMCEKFCHCKSGCARKFSGCGCATAKVKRGQRTMCFDDERCICFMMNRECDPDLCGSCGVCEVSDPINRYKESILKDRCRNASLQRGVPKRTLIGNSGIHGFGLYAGENIDMHEFVGEYKGEIITKEEGERRGAVYEHQKLSYLFTLNTTQEIDSTYFGNKIRFINHAGNSKNNLYPRIFFVGGVHRIALFAERPIRTGEELFFDYGPMFPGEQLGGAAKSAPRVRNSKTMREADDVEFEEDEHGIRRARKAPRARGRSKKQALKSRSEPGRKKGMARHVIPSKSRKTAAKLEASTQAPKEDAVDIGDMPADRSAGARLSAYNISDDLGDTMDVDGEAPADQDFEPAESEEVYVGGAEGQAHVDEQVDVMLRPRRVRPRNRA